MNSIWRNRDFVFLVGGQTLSQFGAAIFNFTLPWLLLEMTGSAAKTGFAFAIGFLPYLLMSLPSGVWADQYDRKKIMIFADVGRLLLLVILPFSFYTNHFYISELYLIQAGVSALSALFDAAYGSCLPALVGREQLKEANTILMTGMSTSQVLGPAIGGTVVAVIGAPYTISVTAITYIISVFSLMVIRKKFNIPSNVQPIRNKMFHQIKEGFQFVWNHKTIRLTALFAMITNFLICSTNIALLIRIQKDLQFPANIAGVTMAFWSGGQILGAFMNKFLINRFSLSRIITSLFLLQIVPPFIVAFAHSSGTIAIAFGAAGVLLSIWNIQIVSLRQSLIPDEIMGRATTSIRLLVMGFVPLGNLFGGITTQVFGATTIFLFEGITRAIMFMMGFYLFKELQEDAPVTQT